MEKVKAVPDRVPNHVNYKIIILCFLASTIFHYTMTFFGSIEGYDELSSYVIEIIFVLSPLVSGIFAFIIAGFYRLSKVFGRSYLFLGLGYFSSVAAELIYAIQSDIMKIDPYPSIADPFYAALNIFLIIHIITITNFFARTVDSENGQRQYVEIRTLLIFILIFCTIVFSYIAVSISTNDFQFTFEFFYGLFFVALAGITLPFLAYAVTIFKNSALGKSWHVLLLSFMVLIVGDVWYYYLEIFEQYHIFHPVNILWISSYWLQTYALFTHKKVT